MTAGLSTRRIAIAAAGAALAAMGALTACSPTTEKEAPTSTTTPATSSTSAGLTPSEKAVGPGATNSFSPTVRAGQPGAVCQQLVNGVCVR